MLPVTSKVAVSPTVKNSGQFCRIKLRSSSGTVTLRCRKSPMLRTFSFNGSQGEIYDPVFGELSELPEYRGFYCNVNSAQHYFTLQPDFSVYYFWSEMDRNFEHVNDIVADVAEFPALQSDFIVKDYGDDVVAFDDREAFAEENEGFEWRIFDDGQTFSEKSLVSTDSFDSCNSSSLEFSEDHIIEMIPEPLRFRERQSPIMRSLTELEASNVLPFSSEHNHSDTYCSEVTSSGNRTGKKLKATSTSRRSHKRTRLNPSITREFSSRNFSSNLELKSVDLNAELKKIREKFSNRNNDFLLCTENLHDEQNLRCNEVLTESSEEGSDMEFVQISRKDANASKSAKKSRKIRRKVNRAHLPQKSVNVLKAWIDENMQNPYASKEEKSELVELSGLTLNQVENWLSNTRYRLKIQKARPIAEIQLSSPVVRKTLTARNKKKRFDLEYFP